MKKLLIQIDCKDEMPEVGTKCITDLGELLYYYVCCPGDPSYGLYFEWTDGFVDYDVTWWLKEVDQRTYDINLLDKYSIWLCKNGYIDTDYKDEPPFAIDEFLKTLK